MGGRKRPSRFYLPAPDVQLADMVILRTPIAGVSEAGLSRFATRTCRAARLKGHVEIAIVGRREMRTLNQRFRGKDVPTDVLSFPAGKQNSASRENNAGDIAICAPIAAANAKRLGHSTGEEIKILILHGVLHLAGYDHETDRGEMAKVERRLRTLLKLPDGLIERNDPVGEWTSSGPKLRGTR